MDFCGDADYSARTDAFLKHHLRRVNGVQKMTAPGGKPLRIRTPAGASRYGNRAPMQAR